MMSPSPTLSTAEREAVVLASTMGIIDDMVNHVIFSFLGEGEHRQPMPTTATARSYFALRLSDFLSQTDKDIGIPTIPYLRHLSQIVQQPSFGDPAPLRQVIHPLSTWLRERKTFNKVWLPTLSIEVNLSPTRLSWLKVAGNLQKHDVLRSTGTAREIAEWLADADHDLGHMEILGALDDFRSWLTDDAFSAYIVPLAYWLNELRWATFGYLLPYYNVNYVQSWDEHLQFHRYRFEDDPRVTTPFAKAQRHELLNWIRKHPIVARFSVDDVWHRLGDIFSSR
ncbi:hypothetical protein KCV01_g1158, partial [Aureobasidium melanogenum]